MTMNYTTLYEFKAFNVTFEIITLLNTVNRDKTPLENISFILSKVKLFLG